MKYQHFLRLRRLSIKATIVETPQDIFIEVRCLDKSGERRRPKGDEELGPTFQWFRQLFEKYEDDQRQIYSRDPDTGDPDELTGELLEMFTGGLDY